MSKANKFYGTTALLGALLLGTGIYLFKKTDKDAAGIIIGIVGAAMLGASALSWVGARNAAADVE